MPSSSFSFLIWYIFSQLQKRIVYIVTVLEEDYTKLKQSDIAQYVKEIEDICGIRFKKDQDIRRQLAILLDAMYRNVSVDDAKLITSVSQETGGFCKSSCEKKWFDNVDFIDFETIKVPIPHDYDKVLQAIYGNDYMIPKRNNVGHEYPFYRKQKEEIKRELCNELGYEDREKRVAEALGIDVTEVFEYKRLRYGGTSIQYLYFCQKEMREITFGNDDIMLL